MTTTTQPAKANIIVSNHEIAEVRLNTQTNHHSLHVTKAFESGAVVTNFFAADTFDRPTYLTVQTGTEKHITLSPSFLQYINHSCDPNVFFDTSAMQLISLKPIRPGDELRFFYPSTEWEMAQPFVCDCAGNDCLQLINGAAHLDQETLSKYLLTDFIIQQIKQKHSLNKSIT